MSSGSSPLARSATVTCSSTDRRADRTAIHIEMNGSWPPSAVQFVRPDAADRGERAIEGADHIGDGDRVGRAGEQPAAFAAAHAAHEFGVAELAEDVEQESRGHVVAFRQDGARDRSPGVLSRSSSAIVAITRTP